MFNEREKAQLIWALESRIKEIQKDKFLAVMTVDAANEAIEECRALMQKLNS